MENRRRSRRVAPDRETCVSIGGIRTARLVDITCDGAHLELGSALNPNQTTQISLHLGDASVRLKARVVHCKLTGYNSFGSGGQLVYHAGIEFLEMNTKLASAISEAFPFPESRPVRRGPIKIKVDTDALERAAAGRKADSN